MKSHNTATSNIGADSILTIANLSNPRRNFVSMLQGNTVRGEGSPEATGFWIHGKLHELHPNAGCIVHTHQPWATSLACTMDPT